MSNILRAIIFRTSKKSKVVCRNSYQKIKTGLDLESMVLAERWFKTIKANGLYSDNQ